MLSNVLAFSLIRLVVQRQELCVSLEKQILLKASGVVWNWMSP